MFVCFCVIFFAGKGVTINANGVYVERKDFNT